MFIVSKTRCNVIQFYEEKRREIVVCASIFLVLDKKTYSSVLLILLVTSPLVTKSLSKKLSS